MTTFITSKEIDAAVKFFQSVEFTNTTNAVKTAIASRLKDVNADAVAVEDILSDLAPYVPVLGEVSTGLKVAILVYSLSAPQPGGGVFGALVDSINGVQRTVDDPSGDNTPGVPEYHQ